MNQIFLYYGHDPMLILKINPIIGFESNYLCLEKEMATHSSILAWRIPWTEKSEIVRVRHDLVTKPQPTITFV